MRSDIDFARDWGYNARMLLRRTMVLASLIAYLGVGVCRQACAFDFPAPRPDIAAVASGCDHCHESGSSRHSQAPCCVHSEDDASVLLPAQAVILPARVYSVAFVSINPPAMIPDTVMPSALASRAPPGAVPSVPAQALHGPRPPPSLLAIL